MPRWIPIAAVAVLVLLIVVAVAVTRGGSSESDAGACLTDLSKHLPDEQKIVYGTDLVQARSAGYDDSDELEELGTSIQKTGTLPDPLTGQVRFSRLVSVEDFTGQTGVAPDDIRCSLSSSAESVLSGSFDAAEVGGSALGTDGRLVASDDYLVVGSVGSEASRKLLEEQDESLADDDDVSAVLSSLRDQGAYSLLIQSAGSKGTIRAAGLGVGGSDDARQAMLAWGFDDDGAAEEGKREVVERANDALQGSTSIDASDLQVEGKLITATIDVRKAPDLQRILSTQTPLIRSGS